MNWDEAHLLGDLEAQEARMTDDLVKLLRRPYGNLTFAEKEEVADRIEELEAKLAQQDDLVQAAVAAALREAVAAVKKDADNDDISQGAAQWVSDTILALIAPDAQAALDRALAAERERCAHVIDRMAPYTPEQIAQMSDIDRFAERRKINISRAYHADAAAIRKGGE